MYLQPIPAYVYKIRHLLTGQYYFGFRKAHIKANRTPEQDLAKWGTINTREIAKLKRRNLIDKM